MSFGGFDQSQSQRPISDINVTPLVDVMLVLLVIFIITAPLFASSIKLNLPNTKTAVSSEKSTALILSINAESELFWNDIKIPPQELETRFKALAEKTPDMQLRLRIDKQVSFDKVAQVLSAAQTYGFTKIGFVTTSLPVSNPPSVQP
ncbi:MAG: biopolymer transporter ExbD [Burkholderiaceae bacterium]|nr:biopolymer transporter ExbD [Burkholderiaceae bacterium]